MKRIFSILALMLLVVTAWCDEAETIEKYYKQLKRLTPEQTKIMLYSYEVGSKYDLGYSLAAIAWKESKFGKYLMNVTDGKLGSYGVYHILLEYAIVRAKIKSDWEISRYAERLTSDIELSAEEALSELLFWKSYFKGKPFKAMFAGYNAGTAGLKSTAGSIYADDAILRIRAMERFFKENKILEKLKRSNQHL